MSCISAVHLHQSEQGFLIIKYLSSPMPISWLTYLCLAPVSVMAVISCLFHLLLSLMSRILIRGVL